MRVGSIIMFNGLFCLAITGLVAAPLLQENWSSGSINTNVWIPNLSGSGYVAVDEYAPGEFALAMDNPLTGQDYVRTVGTITSFNRGKNLRCTFRYWNDTTRVGGISQPAPFYGGINGPWLSQSDPVSQPLYYQWPEAIIYGFPAASNGFPPLSLREGTNSNPPVNTDTLLPTAFTDAFNTAISWETSLLVRVTLGNTRGAKVEYSTNNGGAYQLALDTTSDGVSQVATGLALGFVGPGGFAFYDDIVVEDDDNQLSPTSPTAAGATWIIYR